MISPVRSALIASRRSRLSFRHCAEARDEWCSAKAIPVSVWTGHKRVEKLRYMHRNPVTRGLVASPELWQWSSFRSYFLGEAGKVRVNDWNVLKMKIRRPVA
jgi:hypothetical protein